MQNVEPYYGWLALYDSEQDENSPFYEVEHNLFDYDRQIYNFVAHPQWEYIGSESLLVKILFADYRSGYAIIEMIGEWNDLHENDYKLFAENCLTYLVDAGINKFILVCENVFNAYLETDDYYEALQEELEDGWICLVNARPGVLDEMKTYGIDVYLFSNPVLESLQWRKMRPWQLFDLAEQSINRLMLT